jgi:pyrroloquinoline quinone (PQQ) biosynthesis protein C
MQLRDALRAELHRWPVTEARIFKVGGRSGAPRTMLQSVALQIAAGAIDFPHKLSRLLAATRDPLLRQFLIGNLLEEEGLEQTAEDEVVRHPERAHETYALRLAAALDVGAEAVRGAPPPAYPYFDRALADGRWRAAMAFLNIGMEGQMPRISPAYVEMFRRHGLAAADLIFFEVHGEADVRHSEGAVELAAQLVKMPAHGEELIDGAREGAAFMWGLLNGGPARPS